MRILMSIQLNGAAQIGPITTATAEVSPLRIKANYTKSRTAIATSQSKGSFSLTSRTLLTQLC